MSIISVVLKILSILQTAVPQPWHVLSTKHQVIPSRLYFNQNFKYFLTFLNFSFSLSFLLIAHRLCWLFFYWKSYSMYHMDQAVLYGIQFCMLLIFLAIYHMHHNYHTNIIYMLNQLFQLCQLDGSTKICKDPYELFVYLMSAYFVPIIPCITFAPFVISQGPLQLIFGCSYFAKTVESISYTVVYAYNSITLLSIVLVLVMAIDILYLYASKLHFSTNNLSFKLSRYFARLRIAEILFRILNKAYGLLVNVLVIVGILLASCSGSLTIRWYGKVDF